MTFSFGPSSWSRAAVMAASDSTLTARWKLAAAKNPCARAAA
jgi:hypothetical protein